MLPQDLKNKRVFVETIDAAGFVQRNYFLTEI